MNCTDPKCYLAGNEHEHISDKPGRPPKPPKARLTRPVIQSIAKRAAAKVMKYWVDDFMTTHGRTEYESREDVLRTVAYSLDHFADDTSIKGILGLED
jgi:hypothetical protein